MDTSRLTQFHKDLAEWGITLTAKQDEQFLKFYELLLEWNSFMNLTAITEFDEVMKKHFLDSLSFIHYLKKNPYVSLKNNSSKNVIPAFEKCNDSDIDSVNAEIKLSINEHMDSLSKLSFTMIDVGTGAGFPGLPLAILFPSAKFTLMDSLNKRIKFLNEVITQLGLTNVETVHSRAEDLARNPEYREKFDYSVSRAVANLSTLSEYCLPFVKVEGKFISYKSERLSEELVAAENAIVTLGGIVKDQIDFQLPESDIYRNLLVIQKMKPTSKKYPRKAGLPAKEPLK